VQNYSMRYRKELSLVLEGLSFEVKAKEKVGIVGRTGAGKSSLIHALLRIVEPDSGRICIDGVDVSTMGVRKLRSHITVVPQDPMLFEGTIRDNLDPENKYSDEQIWEAMKRAQIDELVRVPTGKYTGGASADQIDRRDVPGEWIAGTGLEKWVEPDGKNFSVGQRQLVCLCRALLWQRSIVILDEATANVDTATDAIIQEIIRTQFKQCTVITIAHRLNTIMDSDRVLVMDQKKAVEFDTPERLLQQKNSRFAQLVRNTEFEE
ncbi:hypothetical protein IWW54_000915, partial [Coemansia sp. RSA 2705]